MGNVQRPRVLVVDDEALIGRVLARTLAPLAEVEVAQSGAEALGRIESLRARGLRFDLVLCDVMMPGMYGPELFDRVKGVDPPTARSFVFVTGGASSDQLESIRATGAPCLRKPLDLEAVRGLLKL